MAVRSETGQALANAVDQPIEAGRVVGVDALALDRLRRCQRLAGSLLGADHVESRVGRILLPPGVAQSQPAITASGAWQSRINGTPVSSAMWQAAWR